MSRYELTPEENLDLLQILLYTDDHQGEDRTYELEGKFTEAFERLAATPGLGHRRPDLTTRPQFFYLVEPYLIVYAREADPLPIIRILHSARNLRKLLK